MAKTDEKTDEKTEEKPLTAEDFIKEYKALCQKYQMQVSVVPVFKARDDGTWSVVLQSNVGRLPSNK